MGLKFLHSKIINKMKRKSLKLEKIFANHISDKGFVSQIDTGFLNLIIKRQIVQLKIGKRFGQFSKENIQMVNKHIKRDPASLIIREMQIKIAVRYHCIATRMDEIKKVDHNKCWRECGTIALSYQECKIVQLFWDMVRQFLKK